MFATSEPNPCEYCGLVLYAKLDGGSCDRRVGGGFAADDSAWGGGAFLVAVSFSFSLVFFRAATYRTG